MNQTLWLSQKLMAELFGVDVRTVSEHLKNIFASHELTPEATISKFRIVQREGQREVSRAVDFYNLDAIISFGYRVNSIRATQFRQWATGVLREFAIKAPVGIGHMAKGAAISPRHYRRRRKQSELRATRIYCQSKKLALHRQLQVQLPRCNHLITHCLVTTLAPFPHAQQRRVPGVDEVDDTYALLAHLLSVQATSILLQRAFP
ncbi:Virulence protein [Bordetella ansorpii]|uniref:Virulence protein n=1 Tax=Bordetella ansorpii TaxID=288768 RepID=A0A157S8V9_9BORD|nr:Virulence protein [Bordetella ansorpii]